MNTFVVTTRVLFVAWAFCNGTPLPIHEMDAYDPTLMYNKWQTVIPASAQDYDVECNQASKCAFLIYIPTSATGATCILPNFLADFRERHSHYSVFFNQTHALKNADGGIGVQGRGCTCDTEIHFSSNPKHLKIAHAIMVSVLDGQIDNCVKIVNEILPPKSRPRNQKWIGISMEPGSIYQNNRLVNYPRLRKKYNLDYIISNDAYSDMPISHITNGYLGNFRMRDFFAKPINSIIKKKPRIMAMYSNCNTGEAGKRTAFIAALCKHFDVDSFGACHHTADLPPEMQQFTYTNQDYVTKLNVMSEYVFSLAFDNTEDDYNSSEKLWHSLLAGSIPGIHKS